MARRSAEDTRRLLIDIGLRMLHERGPSAAVAHIRLSTVLRRAGMTTGAAYRIWSDQDAYQRELAVHALEYRDRASNELTVQAVLPVLMRGGSWQDAVRAGSEVNLHPFPEHLPFLTMLAVRASGYGDPEISAASHRRHAEAVSAHGELYAAVLAWSRRRMRAGFELVDLTTALAAISEGFGLQRASGIDHRRLRLDDAGAAAGEVDWSLLGVCATAVCERMTEPDPVAPPVDVASLERSLVAAIGNGVCDAS